MSRCKQKGKVDTSTRKRDPCESTWITCSLPPLVHLPPRFLLTVSKFHRSSLRPHSLIDHGASSTNLRFRSSRTIFSVAFDRIRERERPRIRRERKGRVQQAKTRSQGCCDVVFVYVQDEFERVYGHAREASRDSLRVVSRWQDLRPRHQKRGNSIMNKDSLSLFALL